MKLPRITPQLAMLAVWAGNLEQPTTAASAATVMYSWMAQPWANLAQPVNRLNKMNTPIADLFAARIATLKQQSDETNRSIQQHLASVNQLIATLEEVDRDYPED